MSKEYTINQAALMEDLHRYADATGREWSRLGTVGLVNFCSAAAPFIGMAYEAGQAGRPLREILPWMVIREATE